MSAPGARRLTSVNAASIVLSGETTGPRKEEWIMAIVDIIVGLKEWIVLPGVTRCLQGSSSFRCRSVGKDALSGGTCSTC